MLFRCTVRHTQLADIKTGGWGESFWSQAGSLSDAIDNTKTLRDAMFQLKGNQTALPSSRITPWPAANRQTKLVAYAVAQAQSTVAGFDSDYPTQALLLKLISNGGYETLQWLRGIPDNVITGGGKYTPGNVTGFVARMNTFLGILKDSSQAWCQYKLNTATPTKIITSVALATGIVTSVGHGLAALGSVKSMRLSGFLSPRGLNKVWNVIVDTVDTVKLLGYVPPSNPNVAVSFVLAKMREQIKIPIQINDAVIVRATEHYTGRPTELLGGRRRNRRSHRAGTPVDA
jgi:hypothetical protein